jgi:hypothetical protein
MRQHIHVEKRGEQALFIVRNKLSYLIFFYEFKASIKIWECYNYVVIISQ